MLAIITPEIDVFLKHIRLCFVATVTQDGKPNVSPKGTLAVLNSEHLVFANIRSPDTVENITKNPNIEISAIDPISRRGYLFTGTATYHTDSKDLDMVSKIYSDMNIKSKIKGIVIMKIKSVSEVTSPLYDTGVTEQQIRKSWIKQYLQS